MKADPMSAVVQRGRHIIEMMMGIFESAAYGTRVQLPQPDRRHPVITMA